MDDKLNQDLNAATDETLFGIDADDETVNLVIYGVPNSRCAEMQKQFQINCADDSKCTNPDDGERDLHHLYTNHLLPIAKTPNEVNWINFMFGGFVTQYNQLDPMQMIAQMMGQMGEEQMMGQMDEE